MRLLVSEKQLELILSRGLDNQEVMEQDASTPVAGTDPAAAQPTAGTSSSGEKSGYPEVGKWESGVTRGAANQVGVTKWSDVVGASLKRGKSNPLK